MAITWPAALKPRDVLFHPQNASRGGGPALNGAEQFVASLAGRWRATIAGVKVATREEVLAAQAFIASMEGRANTVLVPSYDCRGPAGPAALNAAALLGATQIAINMTGAGGLLEAGNSLGIANRLYRIKSIVSTIGLVQTVIIWPGLRAAAAVSAVVTLANPVCEMRLASDDSGELMLQLLRFAAPTFEFVEAPVS